MQISRKNSTRGENEESVGRVNFHLSWIIHLPPLINLPTWKDKEPYCFTVRIFFISLRYTEMTFLFLQSYLLSDMWLEFSVARISPWNYSTVPSINLNISQYYYYYDICELDCG